MSLGKEDAASEAPRQPSCTKYFDALWFCYTPVHQLQQYYRLGKLDNCTSHWADLFDCLTLKTKRSSEVEEILKSRDEMKQRSHIWTLRTPDEARSHWTEKFGHLDDQE